MIESGYVRSPEGKMRGGRQGEVHWARGGESLFYYDTDRYVIETEVSNVENDPIGALSLDKIKSIWQYNGKQWVDILNKIKNSHIANKQENQISQNKEIDFDKLKNEDIHFMRIPSGEVYGFTDGEFIYYDKNLINLNTPIHEAGSLWISFIRENNLDLWKKIRREVKDTPYWDSILNDPSYKHLYKDKDKLTDSEIDNIAHEAFETAMGDRGESILHSSMPSDEKTSMYVKIRKLLREVWDWIGKQLRLRDLTPAQIEKLTFRELVDGAIADILRGESITKKRETLYSETDNIINDIFKEAGINIQLERYKDDRVRFHIVTDGVVPVEPEVDDEEERREDKERYKKVFKKNGELIYDYLYLHQNEALGYGESFLEYLDNTIGDKNNALYIIKENSDWLIIDYRNKYNLNGEKIEEEIEGEKLDPFEVAKKGGYELTEHTLKNGEGWGVVGMYRSRFEPTGTIRSRTEYDPEKLSKSVICYYKHTTETINKAYVFTVERENAVNIPTAYELKENPKLITPEWEAYMRSENFVNEDGTLDFTKLKPDFEDPFSLSFLMIRIDKGLSHGIEIISRYNHRIHRKNNTTKILEGNPNAVYNRKINKIVPKLNRALFEYKGLEVINDNDDNPLSRDVKMANDRKLYRAEREYNGIYIGDGFWIDRGNNVHFPNPSEEKLVGKILYNIKTKTIKDITEEFTFSNVNYIRFNKNDIEFSIGGRKEIETREIIIKGEKKTISKEILIDDEKTILSKNDNDTYNLDTDIKEEDTIYSLFNYAPILNLTAKNVTIVVDSFLSSNKILESIDLPNVTNVYDGFLKYNKALKSISLPKVTSIGNGFLKYNKELKSISLPNVTSIGDSFLYYNEELKSINLPNVTYIGHDFLFSNEELESIDLPNVTIVNKYFLYNNKKLKSIDLPKITSIGNNFLFSNEELESIDLQNITFINNGFLQYNKALKSINLPNVTSIDKNFLFYNIELESISLPNIISVGDCFLYNNKKLKSIDLPKVIDIGDFFLYSTRALEHINLPNVTKISNELLSNSKTAESINLPDNVEKYDEPLPLMIISDKESQQTETETTNDIIEDVITENKNEDETEETESEDFQEQRNTEQYDKMSAETSLDKRLSMALRLYFYGLKTVKNGEEIYVTPAQVAYFLSKIYSEYNIKNITELLHVLRSLSNIPGGEFNFLSELADRLDITKQSTPSLRRVIRQIQYSLNLQKFDMYMVNIYNNKIQVLNQNSDDFIVKSYTQLTSNLRASQLFIKQDNGQYLVNKEKKEFLINAINYIDYITKKDLQIFEKWDNEGIPEEIYNIIEEIFNLLGIKMSPGALEIFILSKNDLPVTSSFNTTTLKTALYEAPNGDKIIRTGFFGQIIERLSYLETKSTAGFILDNSFYQQPNTYNKGDITKDLNFNLNNLFLLNKYTSFYVNSSFYVGHKSVATYSQPNFVGRRIKELKEKNTLESLIETPWASQNMLLNLMYEDGKFVQDIIDRLEVSYVSLEPIQKNKNLSGKKLTNHSDSDITITATNFFFSKQKGVYKKHVLGIPLRESLMLFPALSDSDQSLLFRTFVLDLQGEHFRIDEDGKNIVPGSSLITVLRKQLVESDLKRIFAYLEAKQSSEDNLNIRNSDLSSQLFLNVYQMNSAMLSEYNGSKPILEIIAEYVKKGDDFETFITDYWEEINDVLKDIIIKECRNLLYIDEEGNYKGKFVTDGVVGENGVWKNIPSDYENSKNTKGNDEVKGLLYAYDFIINYMLSLYNIQTLFMGDLANLDTKIKKDLFIDEKVYKPVSEDVYAKIAEAVMSNSTKRLKDYISPVNVLADSEDKQFISVILSDIEDISISFDSILKRLYGQNIIKDGEIEDESDISIQEINYLKELSDKQLHSEPLTYEETAFIKSFTAKIKKYYPLAQDYLENKTTDGQEYVTWKHKLEMLLNSAKIDDKQYAILYDKLSSQSKDGVNDNNRLTEEEMGSLFQPEKPLYSGNQFIEWNGYKTQRHIFVKSSAFTLLPQLTQGFKIDKIRRFAEEIEGRNNGKTVRLAFTSAIKLGLPRESHIISIAEILYSEGDNWSNNLLEKASAIHLDYKNYGIQQEKPSHLQDDLKRNKITKNNIGTQMEKVVFSNGIAHIEDEIFDNIFDENVLKLAGIEETGKEKLSGVDLKKIWDVLYKEKVSFVVNTIAKEFGITKDGVLKDKKKAYRKLSKLLSSASNGLQMQELTKLVKTVTEKGDVVEDFAIDLWLTPSYEKVESIVNSLIRKSTLRMKVAGSFGILGSQLGFDLDLNSDKQSDIIFTESFTGELKSTHYEDGSLKSAQVLMANKFTYKDTDGKVKKVDIKRYTKEVNGRMVIDFDRFPQEILQMFSFRIPTSSHQSGMLIEVVGFLPYGVGDLMIVPKDSTVQMGEDFDIDTRYFYLLNLDVTDEKITKKVSDSLNLDIIDNNLISIYKSIYASSDQKVQKLIAAPISTKFLNDTGNVIDEVLHSETESIFSFNHLLSEIKSGNSGKTGIAISSKAVTFNASLHTFKDKLQFNILSEQMQIGDFVWDGTIGNVYSLAPKDMVGRMTSSIGMELQNTTVDNAKLRSLKKLGITTTTMSTASFMMILVGLDTDYRKINGKVLSYVPLLLQQPIIREYVELLDYYNSVTNDDFGSANSLATNKLREKYRKVTWDKDDKKVQDLAVKRENLKRANSEVLYSQLQGSTDDNFQWAILELYKEMSDYADIIYEKQNLLNGENALIGKSYFDGINLLKNLQNLIDSYFIENNFTSPFLYFIGDMSESLPVPNNFIGQKVVNTANLVNMFKFLFPYTSGTYYDVINDIILNSKHANMEYSPTVNKLQYDIVNDMRQVVYTKVIKSLYNNQSIDKIRFYLFKDIPKSADSLGNKSLATKLYELKYNNHWLFSSPFFQNLSFKISSDEGPSLIFYNNNDTQKENEVIISNLFKELIRNDKKVTIEKVKEDGTKITQTLPYTYQQLVTEMFHYALLSDVSNGAISFLRFFPADFFKMKQLQSTIKGVLKDEKLLDDFKDQFFAHNTNYVQYLNSEQAKHLTEYLGKNLGGDQVIPIGAFVKFFSNFITIIDRNSIYIEKEYFLYSPERGKPPYLYKLTKNGAVRINKLGGYGVKEYEHEPTLLSLFNENNPIAKRPTVKPPIIPLLDLIDETETDEAETDNKKQIKGKNDVARYLINRIDIENDPNKENGLDIHVEVVNAIINLLPDDISLNIVNGLTTKGRFNPATNEIEINDTNHQAVTIIEELLHYLTVNEFHRYVPELKIKEDFSGIDYDVENADIPIQIKRLLLLYNQGIRTIRNIYISKYKNSGDDIKVATQKAVEYMSSIYENFEEATIKGELSLEKAINMKDSRDIYRISNLHEFIAGMLLDKEFVESIGGNAVSKAGIKDESLKKVLTNLTSRLKDTLKSFFQWLFKNNTNKQLALHTIDATFAAIDEVREIRKKEGITPESITQEVRNRSYFSIEEDPEIADLLQPNISQNDEKNSNFVENNTLNNTDIIDKQGNINYEKLRQISDDIMAGRKFLNRLSLAEEQGRTKGGRGNVEASILLSRIDRSNKQKRVNARIGSTGSSSHGTTQDGTREISTSSLQIYQRNIVKYALLEKIDLLYINEDIKSLEDKNPALWEHLQKLIINSQEYKNILIQNSVLFLTNKQSENVIKHILSVKYDKELNIYSQNNFSTQDIKERVQNLTGISGEQINLSNLKESDIKYLSSQHAISIIVAERMLNNKIREVKC